MSNLCAICNSGTTFLFRRKIANNEVVCEDCFKKAKTLTTKQVIKLKTVTADEIRQSISDTVGNAVMNFIPTKVIGTAIQFDDENKRLLIPSSFGNDNIYKYDDIVSYELLEDDEVVTSGGLGRAAIGGMLFGGAGAVVGAVTGRKNKGVCNSLGIKLTLNNMSQPVVYIPFILTKTKTDSDAYKAAASQAQECLSVLQLICNQQEAPASNSRNDNAAGSAADEIKKFKELLDDGILTQEEFDAKKKELLGL
ncbi:SHOCT domain-containing protein [Sporosarcina sp. FSL K6-1522]|uniref:SHOCT domain-containing protein n=1 Tax=Sporosarcina sp. FSL K6-1522 TaxID=2921554 RepID=UPI00315A90B8